MSPQEHPRKSSPHESWRTGPDNGGVNVDAFIALGSNLGDREAYLGMARRILLEHVQGVELVTFGPIIETAPVGGPSDQHPYLNSAAHLRTTLPARELLSRLLAIELAAGRSRGEKWGPRVLDLDLLLFGRCIIREPGLIIPHPHLHERLFVLAPLAAIAPQVEHPVFRRTILDLYENHGRRMPTADHPV